MSNISIGLTKCVTVVIPFYNIDIFLDEALESVYQNKHLVKEVILVCDLGSKPPTFQQREGVSVSVIYNGGPDKGAGICRWMGYSSAKTRYVAFLDADDIWEIGKLEDQVSFMQQENIGFSFHNFRHFTDKGIFAPIVVSGPYTQKRFLKKKFVISCSSVMVDRQYFNFVHRTTLKKRNDYRMWFEIIKEAEDRSIKIEGLQITGSKTRLHKLALTKSKLSSVFYQWLFYRDIGLSHLHCLYYMFPYILNTLRHRVKARVV